MIGSLSPLPVLSVETIRVPPLDSVVVVSGAPTSCGSGPTTKVHCVLSGVTWKGDLLYTAEFRAAMKRGGVEVLRLPPSSPNLNAYAERFVLSIRSECLDRIVSLGERICDGRCMSSCSTTGSSGTIRGSRTT